MLKKKKKKFKTYPYPVDGTIVLNHHCLHVWFIIIILIIQQVIILITALICTQEQESFKPTSISPSIHPS